MSIVFVTLKSVSQYSEINVKEAVELPPQGSAITYSTSMVPIPVIVSVVPTRVAGPLTRLNVPPAGVGLRVKELPTQ